jgi:hypothetical protein
MAKLTTENRKKLSSSTFALPSERKYPIPDRKHAAVAKSYAKQELDNGKLSEGSYKKVVAKANRKLNETKSSPKPKGKPIKSILGL